MFPGRGRNVTCLPRNTVKNTWQIVLRKGLAGLVIRPTATGKPGRHYRLMSVIHISRKARKTLNMNGKPYPRLFTLNMTGQGTEGCRRDIWEGSRVRSGHCFLQNLCKAKAGLSIRSSMVFGHCVKVHSGVQRPTCIYRVAVADCPIYRNR